MVMTKMTKIPLNIASKASSSTESIFDEFKIEECKPSKEDMIADLVKVKNMSATTGFYSSNTEGSNVYPNPFSNEISIEDLLIGSEIQVLDLSGNQVYSANVSSNQIEVPNLKEGFYVLAYSNKNQEVKHVSVVKN